MKHFTLIIALLLGSFAAIYGQSGAQAAQSKLSATTRMFLADRQAAAASSHGNKAPAQAARRSSIYASPDTIGQQVYISAFVRLNGNEDALKQKGVIVQCKFNGGLVTALIPIDSVEAVAKLASVRSVNVAPLAKPSTNAVRDSTRAIDVLANSAAAKALDINSAFDGKGVLIGIIDDGIDYQHIAFKDASGNSRIKRAYVYDGTVHEYTSQTIANATTDDTGEDHGTHTSSIAGGSSVIVDGSNVTVTTDHAAATYGGMAPAADLYLAGIKGLNTAYVANAIQKICNYADSVGQPVVLSNSWGSQLGPHDGTGDIATVLAQYFGDDYPNHICLFAAGNEAGTTQSGEGGGMSVRGASTSDAPLGTIIRSISSGSTDGGTLYNGVLASAWTTQPLAAGQQLACKVLVLDRATGNVLATSSEIIPTSADSYTVDGLGSYYSGTLYALGNQVNSPKSQIVLYAPNGLTTRSGSNDTQGGYSYYRSRYTLAMQVYPTSGNCAIAAWGLGTTYFTNHIKTEGYTWTAGSDSASVDDEATSPNVIAVGAYCTKSRIDDYAGHTFRYNLELGDIAPFSSYQAAGYGTTGTALPFITAPGAVTVAAVNHYHTSGGYIDSRSSSNGNLRVNASTENPYGAMAGTSMATPAAAGIVALWLQASLSDDAQMHNLTVNQVKDVMQRSAAKDAFTFGANSAQFGCGKIDALAGLKLVLGDGKIITGVDEASLNGKPVASITYYNMQGMKVQPTASGVLIKVVTYSDGTKRISKLLAK